VSIAAVITHRVSAPLHTPFVTSLRRAETVDSLIVEIVDSDGRSGFGEAPQIWQVTGASIAGSEACVETLLAPMLVGRDPDDLVATIKDVQRAVVGNEAAKAAIDMAMHDLAAQRLGIPLVRLLGGSSLTVATDVTLSAGDADALAAAAADRVADGFTVLKVKVGTADSAAEIERVRAIREAAGPDVVIRLDANQGWTPREAVRVIHGVEDAGLGVEFVEQPVARWDIEGLAWVSDRVDLPIVADEAVFSVRELVEVIKRRAADVVNVKLAKCGGISAGRTLLSLADAHGLGSIVGSMMETSIGIGAAASLASAYGTTSVCDLDAGWWLADTPIQGGMVYDGPQITLADEPGLGIHGIGGTTPRRWKAIA
jgi:o-succinylbenzoate synthase